MEAAMASVISSPAGAFARLDSSGGSEIFGNGPGFVRLHAPFRVSYQNSAMRNWALELGEAWQLSHPWMWSHLNEMIRLRPFSWNLQLGSKPQILVSHPQLSSSVVVQQLEQLQIDREAEGNKEASGFGTDLVLYGRIAEAKANERKRVLEEILYASVVQKFMDANVLQIPAINPSSTDVSGRVDT